MRASFRASRGVVAALAGALVLGTGGAAAGATGSGTVEVIGRDGKAVTRITDGDTISLRVTLAEKAGSKESIGFALADDGTKVGECAVDAGQTGCTTAPFHAFGWHWHSDGTAAPQRTVSASGGSGALGQAAIDVAARPAILVHGFLAGSFVWATYLGPDGYFAKAGIPGFAVGDGQVPGVLNTGVIADPGQKTNTVFQNARILGEYIAGVKAKTGAQVVDLIGHSLGGIMSRAYIGREMGERDVAQLLMLGSPMSGSDCSALPQSLGMYMPAAMEIRPAYVTGIFNAQVTARHGVPFHALAGTPIIEGFKSPCADVPSDIVVSRASAASLPGIDVTDTDQNHLALNAVPEVFDEFVLPRLKTPAGDPAWADAPDPAPASGPGDQAPAQFSRVFTGHVNPGESSELRIPIEPGVSVAAFSMLDTTRSLATEVRGASGKVITLSAEKNGLVTVDDPSTMFTLGYGFADPKPGEWRITLSASATTPAEGADFALTARFVGGVTLRAQLDATAPEVGQVIHVTGDLTLGADAVPITEITGTLLAPDGTRTDISMTGAAAINGQLVAGEPGLYGLDITVTGRLPDGTAVDRATFLAFAVQPAAGVSWAGIAGIIGAVLAIPILAVVLVLWTVRRRRQRGMTV